MHAERALFRMIYIMNMNTALCKRQTHTHTESVNEKFTCFQLLAKATNAFCYNARSLATIYGMCNSVACRIRFVERRFRPQKPTIQKLC